MADRARPFVRLPGRYAAENRVSDDLHVRLLAKAGWTEDEYAEGSRRDADGAV